MKYSSAVCKALNLPDDQDTKLYIVTEGRARLRPSLLSSYFGNVIFTTTPIAVAGEFMSARLSEIGLSARLNLQWFSEHGQRLSEISTSLANMDNDYLKSALGYLELQPDLKALVELEKTSFGGVNAPLPSLLFQPRH
ncbi:hypothetical protein L1887_20447 [Cichorium endivia]|nr:hypothetical protein L1887_20447 [Cichorium endivia]